jgi:drug/metabolite transporter (DMT)-like permease
VVTLVAHYLWVQATTVLPIEVTGVVAYLQLPISLSMNALFSDQRITGRIVAGAACVVAANLLTVGLRARWSRREQRNIAPPAPRHEEEKPLMNADKRG